MTSLTRRKFDREATLWPWCAGKEKAMILLCLAIAAGKGREERVKMRTRKGASKKVDLFVKRKTPRLDLTYHRQGDS